MNAVGIVMDLSVGITIEYDMNMILWACVCIGTFIGVLRGSCAYIHRYVHR